MSINKQAFEKLKKNGKVAVLYSPGYGAGWYTWSPHYEGLVFDREIVEAVLAENRTLAADIAKKKYPNAYTGGAEDLRVEWIDEGHAFQIDEYDGSESIHVIGQRDYLIA